MIYTCLLDIITAICTSTIGIQCFVAFFMLASFGIVVNRLGGRL